MSGHAGSARANIPPEILLLWVRAVTLSQKYDSSTSTGEYCKDDIFP